MKLKIGDIVKILDAGSTYPEWDEPAREMRLTNWKANSFGEEWHDWNGQEATIVGLHNNSHNRYAGLQIPSHSYDVVIDADCIEFVREGFIMPKELFEL